MAAAPRKPWFSSTYSTSLGQPPDFEPDDEWKAATLAIIHGSLALMVKEAEEDLQRKYKANPSNAQTYREEFKRRVVVISVWVKEQIQAALTKERMLRRWTCGMDVPIELLETFRAEQESIMESIKAQRSAFGEDVLWGQSLDSSDIESALSPMSSAGASLFSSSHMPVADVPHSATKEPPPQPESPPHRSSYTEDLLFSSIPVTNKYRPATSPSNTDRPDLSHSSPERLQASPASSERYSTRRHAESWDDPRISSMSGSHRSRDPTNSQEVAWRHWGADQSPGAKYDVSSDGEQEGVKGEEVEAKELELETWRHWTADLLGHNVPLNPDDDRTTGMSTSSRNAASGRPSTQSTPKSKPTMPTAASTPPSHDEWQARQEELAHKQQAKFRLDQERMERERLVREGAMLNKDIIRTFDSHSRMWATLRTSSELRWDSFPWPTIKKPSVPEDITYAGVDGYIFSTYYPGKDSMKSDKDRIKEHIRKWHPDHFNTKWLPNVVKADQNLVKEGAGQVVRYLNALLEKENSPYTLG